MPPTSPATTPTGWAEPADALPDLLLFPIRMATTTPTITTAATTAPMMTGLGPFFGATAAIFLDASGRMWVVSPSIRTNGDQGCMPYLAAPRATSHTPRLLRRAVSSGYCVRAAAMV